MFERNWSDLPEIHIDKSCVCTVAENTADDGTVTYNVCLIIGGTEIINLTDDGCLDLVSNIIGNLKITGHLRKEQENAKSASTNQEDV